MLCTTYFKTLKLCIPHVFRMVLTINSHCSSKQHLQAGLWSWDVMCFRWSMNWICIYYLEEILFLKGLTSNRQQELNPNLNLIPSCAQHVHPIHRYSGLQSHGQQTGKPRIFTKRQAQSTGRKKKKLITNMKHLQGCDNDHLPNRTELLPHCVILDWNKLTS